MTTRVILEVFASRNYRSTQKMAKTCRDATCWKACNNNASLI